MSWFSIRRDNKELIKENERRSDELAELTKENNRLARELSQEKEYANKLSFNLKNARLELGKELVVANELLTKVLYFLGSGWLRLPEREERLINEIEAYLEEPQEEKKEPEDKPLEGKSFVITGKLSKPRMVVKDFIEINGGEVTNTASEDTGWLVCNAPTTSSKYKKAQSLGVSIITEEELDDLVSGIVWKE